MIHIHVLRLVMITKTVLNTVHCMWEIILYLYRDAQQFERPVSLQDIKDVLQTHTLAVMESSENAGRNYINVRRGHVLNDGIHKINRAIFNPKLPLSVKFADDDGNSEGVLVNFSGCALKRCSQEQAFFRDQREIKFWSTIFRVCLQYHCHFKALITSTIIQHRFYPIRTVTGSCRYSEGYSQIVADEGKD